MRGEAGPPAKNEVMARHGDVGAGISRKRFLAWAGGLGLAALLPGCGDNAPGDGAATATDAAPTTAAATTSTATVDCVLTPETTEGPYYLDLDRVRSDITEGRPGTPLDLAITVVDADVCEPIKDAAVDVWHCDAGGTYSGVAGESGIFLRGTQVTDSNGRAAFQTIFPGWYSGRAVHIHVKVHVATEESYTGQLFFDESLIETVYATDPYSARPGPDVSNAQDGIFGQSRGATIVTVTSRDPLRGAVALGVQRA
jgi:protocatechuate 3,4-dioxygenase beta subunit